MTTTAWLQILHFREGSLEGCAQQLKGLLDETDHLDPFKSGFSPGYGTESALFTLMDYVFFCYLLSSCHPVRFITHRSLYQTAECAPQCQRQYLEATVSRVLCASLFHSVTRASTGSLALSTGEKTGHSGIYCIPLVSEWTI